MAVISPLGAARLSRKSCCVQLPLNVRRRPRKAGDTMLAPGERSVIRGNYTPYNPPNLRSGLHFDAVAAR